MTSQRAQRGDDRKDFYRGLYLAELDRNFIDSNGTTWVEVAGPVPNGETWKLITCWVFNDDDIIHTAISKIEPLGWAGAQLRRDALGLTAKQGGIIPSNAPAPMLAGYESNPIFHMKEDDSLWMRLLAGHNLGPATFQAHWEVWK